MSLNRRKVTFQLVPLLDLMLIVVFAQLMEVRQRGEQESQRAALALEQGVQAQETGRQARERARQLGQELAAAQRRSAELQAQLDQGDVEMRAALSQAREERDRIAALTAEMFQVPDELLRKILAARDPAELARIRQVVSNMPQGGNAVKQLLTIDQLRKSSETWDIHIDDSSVVRLSNGRDSSSFRADTPAEFEKKFFEWYKSLSPPKSIVIVMLSWGDATAKAREAARIGVIAGIERMRADRNGRSLFEYVVLGFKPGES